MTFVEIGGLTAVINIPELSWRPINHPSDIVTVGKEVTAEILDIDPERRRVALSLKALQNDPLVQLQQRIGKTFTGLVPFGAFVRVEDRTDSFDQTRAQRTRDSAVSAQDFGNQCRGLRKTTTRDDAVQKTPSRKTGPLGGSGHVQERPGVRGATASFCTPPLILPYRPRGTSPVSKAMIARWTRSRASSLANSGFSRSST